MRKLHIFFGFVAVAMIYSASAHAACVQRELGWSAIANSDEYLYQSQSDYAGKYAFECGGDYCPGRQMIFMRADHYHKGELIGRPRIYSCKSTGDQMWIDYNVNDLSDCSVGQCNITQTADMIDGWYIMDRNDGNSGLAVNSGLQLLIQSETSICKCREIGGAKEPVKSKVQQDCEAAGGKWVNNTCDCGNGKVWKNRKCQDKSSGGDGAGQKKPGDDKPRDDNNNSAPRVTPGEEPVVEVVFTCPTGDMTFVYQAQGKYAGSPEIIAIVNQLIALCTVSQNRTQAEFDALMAQLRALIDLINGQQLSADQSSSRAAITAAHDKLSDMIATFKRSDWKNVDGGFNTARLASDSIAGVVLGTAGGLITSSVVKKNQVENGFEDIQCAIGGQVVAGWGDEFIVGIR